MTIDDLKAQGCILFECISGSRAYGLATPTSDTDIKGVFVLPRDRFYGLDYVDQVNDAGNNVVYFELRKFIDLLSKNNPNMLELLSMPADCILYAHPLYARIRPEDFLSKLCKDAFAGYAMAQLKKARGLNKKILNPMEGERKGILDFCYVVEGQGSVPVLDFLKARGLRQEDCGLVAIPHMREVYGLYHDPAAGYHGIVRSEDSMDVAFSSVSKGAQPIGIFSFNKDGYATYCKDYKEYWAWVEARNPHRYTNTITHGKNYDAKNMMHTFRLLDMAEEIARLGQVVVRRPNRDFLLSIKHGEFEYAELAEMANAKLAGIEALYAASGLPEAPDLGKIERLLVGLREDFYKACKV